MKTTPIKVVIPDWAKNLTFADLLQAATKPARQKRQRIKFNPNWRETLRRIK